MHANAKHTTMQVGKASTPGARRVLRVLATVVVLTILYY